MDQTKPGYDPSDPVPLVGRVRAVLMPAGHLGERIAIAVVGQLHDSKPFARVISPKLLKCLPNDLGHALLNYGSIVARDFEDFVETGYPAAEWEPPLGGLQQTDPIDVEGIDVDSVIEAATRLCALWSPSRQGAERVEELPQPRASDEVRFFESVREEVIRRRPGLSRSFKRSFSLSGGNVLTEIDFVGSQYATCYAAINPRARQSGRITNASAALWRLARARDAFGFASPKTVELTAWVPPEGLPIYSAADYETVRETVAELAAQAAREQLTVCPLPNSIAAARRLLESETGATSA